MSLHPFIKYLRIIGKGRHGSRPLSREEARDALGMIIDGEALPQQVSAFFVLIRVREETPEEAAGFVEAIRARLPSSPRQPTASIDWGSYAGKRRHPPWFLLAIKILAQQGERVLIHGIIGPSSERLYTQNAIAALEIPSARTLIDAQQTLSLKGLCYIALDDYCPALRELLHLQAIIGLRTPLHSVARMLNPLQAPLSVHGVFHRKFDQIHQQTATVLGENNVLAFRGEGGEAEVRPEIGTSLCLSCNGVEQTLTQASCSERAVAPSNNDLEHLTAVWRGERQDNYGEQSIIATLAAVRTAQYPLKYSSALEWARLSWTSREVN